MTDKCPSCGKTLEVWTADEGICYYVPCECQLEHDLEAARRVPADAQLYRPRSQVFVKIEEINITGVSAKKAMVLNSAIIFDAACAAPRLAAEVERLRAENTRLRECAERVSHAWKFIDPDNIKIMSDAVTALDDALHPHLRGNR